MIILCGADDMLTYYKIISMLLFTLWVNNNALCLSMQEKLPVAGPFNTKTLNIVILNKRGYTVL